MKNEKSSAFPLLCVKSEQFVSIMRATECVNFVIEVINIATKSDFYISAIYDKNYQISLNRNTDKYANIIFRAKLNDKFEKIIGNILKSKPEAVLVHCGQGEEKEQGSLKLNSNMVLDFMLDENVLLLTCNGITFKNIQLSIKRCLVE